MVEIDSFRYLTSSDGEEDGAAAVVASLMDRGTVNDIVWRSRRGETDATVVLERRARFDSVRSLDEDELVLEDFVEDALCEESRVGSEISPCSETRYEGEEENGNRLRRRTISFQALTMLSM